MGLGWPGQAGVDDAGPTQSCSIDLSKPGKMKDIVSNALMRGLHVPEADVAAFLVGAEKRYATGSELLEAAATRFEVDEQVLSTEVEKFKHCNCTHGRPPDEATDPLRPEDRAREGTEVSAFAKDVTLHVVLHELGHALVREFDIPILGNEETMADAFATYYLTTYMPDRAVEVLTARVRSLMIEAREEPERTWSGEHDHDGRRAYQIAALAVAADPEKYEQVAAAVEMSEEDVRDARDYGSEIRRSWRRVLSPLCMPEGERSAEARVVYDADSAFLTRLCADGLASEIESAVSRFDWHSLVTVRFVDGDGGAGWNRSGRTVTVHGAYVRRFVEQGAAGR
jgi:hypothetical protein